MTQLFGGREFQSISSSWVKDLSVRTLENDNDRGASCTVRLNIEKAVEIRRLF